MDLETIETTAVNTWLKTVRLPLTSAEIALRRTGDQSWPPSLLFEGFEALVRDRAGSLLRNEELIDQARLQRSEISARKRALSKRAKAEQTSQQAQAEYEAKRRAAKQAEERIEQRAQQREAELERERRNAEGRLARASAEVKAKAAETDQRVDKALDEKARSAKANQLDAEQRALAEKERALRAKERALEVDAELDRTKARRKASG